MKIYVDIDNTICITQGTSYLTSVPIKKNIEKINKLFKSGHEITYWSARGVGSNTDQYELTKFQLEAWGCKYHNLLLTKEPFDLLIDDKCINSNDFFKEKIDY